MNIKKKLEKYLAINLQELPKKQKMVFRESSAFVGTSAMEECQNISDYIDKNKDENTFQTKLFSYIDKQELKDSDVYNKVNIDRRLFSKIRSNKDYHPSKETVILLGISLELTEEEIEDLLESASYSLPKNTTFDLIIRFCFKEQIYDVNQINEFLYEHHCKLLNE